MRPLAALLLLPLAALAADQALLSRDLGVEPKQEVIKPDVFEDVVVAPIPISNPTVGTGLAMVVMPFYHLGADSPLSNTTLAAGLMSSGTWGVAAAQSTRLRGDELRIDGYLGYVEIHYRFYGQGSAAGSAGVSVPIVQNGYAFAPELLLQVAKRTFVGVRYRGLRIDTTLEEGGTLPPAIAAVFPGSLSITSSGFGPVAVFDSRDNDMNPGAGMLLDFRANFADQAFGSDFTYQTASLAANVYRRAGPGVVGLRGFLCGTSQRAPLFDLCLFGSGSDLRGYETGRYRDQAMVALQGEYRFPVHGRFGGVVFGGWGKVAPSFGSMGEQPDLPSVGAGVRWLASEKARVNLSLDVARGRDATSFYMYVKEAF